MTLFFYLNDVEEGGETVFPYINISITPVAGSALLWTNVLPYHEDITRQVQLDADQRMFHEASVVMKGVKYAMNVWVHRQDFKHFTVN